MGDSRTKLFQIAESQQGYFTYQQAILSGYKDKNHNYYVREGEWKKIYRGVYRLSQYPIGEREELVVWSLWSRNRKGEPQGVYSHYTALDLYELSDYMPSKLHLTVPKKFQRFADIPEILVIHKNRLKEEEMSSGRGYKLTTPLRTLIDVIEVNELSDDLLAQAAREAKSKGYVTKAEVERAQEQYSQSTIKKLLRYMGY